MVYLKAVWILMGSKLGVRRGRRVHGVRHRGSVSWGREVAFLVTLGAIG